MKPDPFIISIDDCLPCPNLIALSRPFPNLNRRSLPAIAAGIEVSRSPHPTSCCRHRRSLPAAASDSSSTFLCDGPSLYSYCGPTTGTSDQPWWAGQVLGYHRPWPAMMNFFSFLPDVVDTMQGGTVSSDAGSSMMAGAIYGLVSSSAALDEEMTVATPLVRLPGLAHKGWKHALKLSKRKDDQWAL